MKIARHRGGECPLGITLKGMRCRWACAGSPGACSSQATATVEGEMPFQSANAPGRRGVRTAANRSVQWKTRTSAIPIDSASPVPDLCDSGCKFSLDPPTTVWRHGPQEARRSAEEPDRGFALANDGIRKRVGHCHDSLATDCIADDHGPRVEAHAPRKNASGHENTLR
jgi:hypothetical protein